MVEAPGIEAETGNPVSTSPDQSRSKGREKKPVLRLPSIGVAGESTRTNGVDRESVSGVRDSLEEVLGALEANRTDQARALIHRLLGRRDNVPSPCVPTRPEPEFDQEFQAAFDAAFPSEKDS